MAGAEHSAQEQWQLANVMEDVRQDWRNPKKLLGRLNGWVASQPPYIEAVVATIGGGGQASSLARLLLVETCCVRKRNSTVQPCRCRRSRL